jgi:CPA1 family monovalent cation:H+ antiporter
MELTTVIIILLLAIIVSNVVDRLFPWLPLPLIQIVVGVVLSFTAVETDVTLEPDIFMAVLVAPLLFREAEEADLVDLLRVRRPVIIMAFVLVFITVFAIGFYVHAVIPAIPLAACFALGAILGPTDAIAVTSLSNRINVPGNILTILKGEGLINDASGVISFHFAVATLLTGSFAFFSATGKFLLTCIGGFLVGMIIVLLKEWITALLKRLSVHSSATMMLIEILTPFICYLAAETVGVSGILAAVSAGVRQSLHISRMNLFEAEFRTIKKAMWEMLTVIFNALVFLLLGLQLPQIVRAVITDPNYSLAYSFFIAFLVMLVLMVVRFISVLLFAGSATGNKTKDKLMNTLILTLSGVKGTVSLATAFSLPLYIGKVAFAPRSFLLLITACVIVYTLIIASVVLPLISKSRKNIEQDEQSEKYINVLIDTLDILDKRNKKGEDLGAAVLNLKRRIKELQHDTFERKERRELRKLHEYSQKYELQVIQEKYHAGEITEAEYALYVRILRAMMHMSSHSVLSRVFAAPDLDAPTPEEVARAEDQIQSQSQSVGAHLNKLVHENTYVKRNGKLKFGKKAKRVARRDPSDYTLADSISKIFWDNTPLVIEEIKKQAKGNSNVSELVVSRLVDERLDLAGQVMEGEFGGAVKSQLHDEYDRELLISFEIERGVVNDHLARGLIDIDEADQMRVSINLMENYALEDSHSDNVRKLLTAVIKKSKDKRPKNKKS